MSEKPSTQDRTELPTPKRREKAHEEGRVPRSPELVAAVCLLAGASALAVSGGGAIGGTAERMLHDTLGQLSAAPLSLASAEGLMRGLVFQGIGAVAPVAIVIFLSIVLVGGVQARGVLSLKPVSPDLSRLNPLSGFKRLISTQSLFTLFKAMLKLTVLGFLTYTALGGAWMDLPALGGADPSVTITVIRGLVLRLVALVGLGFLVVAVLDYGFSVYKHEKELKMTRQEIVQEHRESEGDPLLKSRMRSLASSLARRRMLHKVKEADVVVVNPVHIAVALRYDMGHDGAPMVLAMGKRKLAERIKELALKAGVPIQENRPLAHALIATAAVGKPIPPALYAAVAEVLAWVYRRRGGAPKLAIAKMVAERAGK